MAERVFLGRYQVISPLEKGGMSEVYLARSFQSDLEVVVKTLAPRLRGDDRARKLFQREVFVLSQIQHPNAVAFIDAAPDDKHEPVLVMEYAGGTSLSAILDKDKRLAPLRVGRLLEQLTSLLDHIHQKGIIHRDLKPGNILVNNPGTGHETIKVVDFGLAVLRSALYIAAEDMGDTSRSSVSGTPQYLSPEQARGEQVDCRSDLYSLGVILFELLTGHQPFNHASLKEMLAAHESQQPPTFAELGLEGRFPPAVEELVLACLAKAPTDRPQTAQEIYDRYREALGLQGAPGTAAKKTNAAPLTPSRGSNAAETPAPRAGEVIDPRAESYVLETLLPESMALVKIKGFVHDLKGHVMESVPGMIHVRLPVKERAVAGAQPSGGFLSWSMKDTPPPTKSNQIAELYLYMDKPTPSAPLNMRLVLRQRGFRDPNRTLWKKWCQGLFRDFHAYLGGR